MAGMPPDFWQCWHTTTLCFLPKLAFLTLSLCSWVSFVPILDAEILSLISCERITPFLGLGLPSRYPLSNATFSGVQGTPLLYGD